jgi:hypothetical protein
MSFDSIVDAPAAARPLKKLRGPDGHPADG